jgi:CHAT domain-containing protein
MVYPRPSAAIRSGSPLPGLGWGAKKVASIHDAANKLRAAGDLAGLESLYSQALDLARGQHNIPGQITQLISLGDVHLLQFRYSVALAEYFEARKLAQASDDAENLGLVNLTLSSLYQQIGDPEDALASAEESRAAFERSGSSRYQAYLLLILARYYSSRHDAQAEGLFLEGIEAARGQSNLPLEAQGWDLLGEYRLARGDIEGAERATVESFWLRVLHYPADLRFSYRRLGALRLAQGLRNEPSRPAPANQELPNEPRGRSRSRYFEEATRLTQKALDGSRDAKSILGAWELLHQLGRIQEAQGRPLEAIQSYRAAVDQAALWWRTLPTAAASLIGANAALHHQVFNAFIEAAAHRALETGDRRLAAESFMAEEFNRASSLRETQALAPVWRSKLPPAYWEALAQLRTEDARELRGDGNALEAQRLHLKISEMETLAGIGFSLSKNENFRSVDSLSHFQQGLKESELLLSFHLGPRESYLWAVTRKTLRLYRLEAEDRIGQRARAFRDAVLGGGASGDFKHLGSELYECLFGQLLPDEGSRPAWLVTQEGPLFEVPFAALVRGVKSKQGMSEYLVERNSVQMVPGALLLRSAPDRPGASGRLVAVGDPVYNAADPRYVDARDSGVRLWPLPRFHWGSDGTSQLNRLVETGHEVAASAHAWTDATGSNHFNQSLVLTGQSSRRRPFLEALQPTPAAIHLATHVLTPPQRPDQAFVAFSLDSTGRPELLATSDIAMLHVPGTLVVMSGCSTAAGESREGAGLLGLTRAWLMAGAAGAIATAWPVQDSAGELLPAFYRYWKTSSTAESLRRSQVDMIRAGGWRSAPSYWAAYQLTGGER